MKYHTMTMASCWTAERGNQMHTNTYDVLSGLYDALHGLDFVRKVATLRSGINVCREDPQRLIQAVLLRCRGLRVQVQVLATPVLG